jgi:hypothetical protein
MTWNCNNIASSGRELALGHLLKSNDVDVASITETEIPASSPLFGVDGYVSYAPLTEAGTKTRVLMLIKTSIATRGNARLRLDLMSSTLPTIWVEVDAHVVHKGGRDA